MEQNQKELLEMWEFKPEVIESMDEAKRISHDPNVKHYNSFKEALRDINNEI